MRTSLIYFLLSLHLTITECNVVVDRLGFPHARISDLAQIQDFPLSPPRDEANNHYRGLSVGVRTTNFNFAFEESSGRLPLIGVTQLHGPAGVEDWQDADHQVGVPRGSVTKQMAHQQALAWLQMMGADVASLEKECRPRIEHLELPLTNRKTVSSAFVIKWIRPGRESEHSRPAAEVALNANANWLVRLDINDLRYYLHPLPRIPHAIAVSLLPDEPVWTFFGLRPGDRVQEIFNKNGWGYTNAFKLLETPPQHEKEARRAMLGEAKELFSILGCDQLDEPNEQNLADIYVNPPAFGSGGRLEFKNGEMQFDTDGRLRLFRFLPRGQTSYYGWLFTGKSTISTNEAYQIAIQKLAALSIDVAELDQAYNRVFGQGQVPKYPGKWGRELIPTPEYWLEWRNRTNESLPAVVKVAVFGDVKQVGRIELQDSSCWKRPPVRVANHQEPVQKR